MAIMQQQQNEPKIDPKIISISNIIYSLDLYTRKDEIQAITSAILRSDENIKLNNIEQRINPEKLKELAMNDFKTPDNENIFKKIIAVVSSVVRGYQELIQADLFDDGSLEIPDSAEPAGKAGKLKLYRM